LLSIIDTDFWIHNCLHVHLLLYTLFENDRLVYVLVLDEGLESLSLDCLSLLTLPRDNNVLKFFILCNPAFTLGYIQFVLIVNTVDKSFYNQIVERIYEELGENVLCQPPVMDPDNVIIMLFSQDIFTANGILKKVESFNGVKRVELFIIT
jgi:hypothetical protein